MDFDQAFGEIETALSGRATDGEKTAAIKAVIDKYRTLTFKTIQELHGYRFVIPSYQRGYKWTGQQVQDLLNDIQEFSESNPSTKQFYCLQPVIVKKEDDKWHLIDGQQRLTTIYLILKYLNHPKLFDLEYNTRTDSKKFLEELNYENCDKTALNIDIHHFQIAMKAIQNWFKNMRYEQSEIWRTSLLEKTKVIWYRPDSIDDSSSEINIFARINSGKIPLTNSELIRALFIHNSKKSSNEETALLQQNKIAAEWDYIEQQLHDNDFWCFITLGTPFPKKYYPNRIEFLFDLIELRKKGAIKTDDQYSTFRMYNDEVARSGVEVADLWQEIKNFYYRFHEWHVDRKLYHLTGYARLADITLTTKILLEKADAQKQSELARSINNEILKILFKDGIQETIDTICYGEKNVKKILLLFNIALPILNEHATPFKFSTYLKDSWDIEHICSQTPEGDQRKWLQAILDYWNHHSDDGMDSLQNRVFQTASSEENISPELIQEVEKYFMNSEHNGETDKDFIDGIGNLCLLDSGTNRGYGNAPFPVKRNTILRQMGSGQFVPPGTQNIFLKTYSKDISNMMFWNKTDADNYRNQIIQTLSALLEEQQNEHT